MSATMNTKYIPKDAQVIMAILKEFGINDYDPRVINQLLEFIYCEYRTILQRARESFSILLWWKIFSSGHTTIILDDARLFANHAKKKNIDVDDVKLAIQMHAEQMSSAGPPRDVNANNYLFISLLFFE